MKSNVVYAAATALKRNRKMTDMLSSLLSFAHLVLCVIIVQALKFNI